MKAAIKDFDPESVVGAGFANFVACRHSALEHLRAVAPQMHLCANKLSSIGNDLKDADATWLIEEAWLSQHGMKAIEELWHKEILLVLPSETSRVTISEALVKFAELRSSPLCKLCPDDLREDLTQVCLHLKAMADGGSVDMELGAEASPVWLTIQARLHWFYRYDAHCDLPSAPINKFLFKTMTGPRALEHALLKLADDVSRRKPWTLKHIQEMRPWVGVFDDTQKKLFNDAVNLSVAKLGVTTDIGLASLSLGSTPGILDDVPTTLAPKTVALGGPSSGSGSIAKSSIAAGPQQALIPVAKMTKAELPRAALRGRVMKSLQGKS
jgi:hypothetical protein